MDLHVVARDKLVVSGLSEQQKERAKKKLTVINPKWRSAVAYSGYNPAFINIEKFITTYSDSGSALHIPRGFDLSDVTDKKVKSKFRYVKKPVDFPEPVILLKSHQQKAFDFFVENKSKRKYKTYLNVLEVAAGKTILSAMIARHTGQRTLVLVHTKLIMDAWISDLCLLYGNDYKKEIGIIQGPKAFLGPHYTIAMCQTWFRRQEYWNDWYKEFGCMIFDECHIAPAKTFCDCANNCPAQYRFGITGTPKRKDGLHKIMYQVFGTPFYEQQSHGEETETSLPIEDAEVIQTKCKLPPYVIREVKYKVRGVEKSKFVKVPPDGERDYRLIMDRVCGSKTRTDLIANVVTNIMQRDRYASVLIATHRREHANKLRRAIRSKSGMGVAMLVGAMGSKRLNRRVAKLKKRKIRCAVATMQFVKTGASIPPFNHLIIATSIGSVQDLEQLSGRIRRKCLHKDMAKIWHVVDWNIPLCKRHFLNKAVPFYRERLKIKRYENYFAG